MHSPVKVGALRFRSTIFTFAWFGFVWLGFESKEHVKNMARNEQVKQQPQQIKGGGGGGWVRYRGNK